MPVVLLVDDNLVQATTRKAILTRSGNDVAVASSAAGALHSLDCPDFLRSLGLVITDHLMPLMNGPEFIHALRKIAPFLPVLVVSGLAEAEAEYDGLDVTFRTKPFAPERLVTLVASLLRGPAQLIA